MWGRPTPVGAARLVWSYVAAIAALVVSGLGFAIADSVQSSVCADNDAFCALGVYLAGGLLGSLVATSLVAVLFRLGWEWWAMCVAVVVAMPTLLDVMGGWAWGVLAAAPAIAAFATWAGAERPRWRPIAVAAVAIVVIAVSLWLTFGDPNG